MRRFHQIRSLLTIMLCSGLAMGPWACGGSGTASEESDALVNLNLATDLSKGTIYGEVLDRRSEAPVADATVTVVLGQLLTRSVATDAAGVFVVTGLLGGAYLLRIDAADYGLYESRVTIPSTQGESQIVSVNANNIVYLDPPCALTARVLLEDAGTPLAGLQVFAIPASSWRTTLHTPQVTNAQGEVTFERIPQETSYSVIVPARDQDADGAVEYSSSYRTAACATTAQVTTLVMQAPIDPNQYAPYGEFWLVDKTELRSISADRPLRLIFSHPVTFPFEGEDGGLILTADRDLVLSTDPLYQQSQIVPITVTRELYDTMLVITPQEALVPNEDYRLLGFLTSLVGDKPVQRDLSDWNISAYVPLADPWGLDEITLDNYNDSNRSEIGHKVYLEFPERVSGTVIVLSTTDTSRTPTTMSDVSEIEIPTSSWPTNNELVIDEGTGGCRSDDEVTCTDHGDVRYRVGLPVTLADHTTEQTRTVTLRLRVHDLDNNEVVGEITRAVQ